MRHTRPILDDGLASGEAMADLFRRVLSDGYVPVQTGRF